jgi:hypothetical protein
MFLKIFHEGSIGFGQLGVVGEGMEGFIDRPVSTNHG